MAKPGPNKTPTKILQMRGSWLADERPDKNSELPSVKPRCPAYFSEEKWGKYAKAFWKKHVQMFMRLGLMTELDVLGYEELCSAFGRKRHAELKVRETDEVVYQLSRRALGVNPWTYRADKHRLEYNRMLDKFGCTPSARGGMEIEIKDSTPKTGKDRFFDEKLSNDRA